MSSALMRFGHFLVLPGCGSVIPGSVGAAAATTTTPVTVLTSTLQSVHVRGIRTPSSWSNGGGRRGGIVNQVLLDKFVKHTKEDCLLNVRAPFHVKIRGSFFDDQNKVDRDRNRKMIAFPVTAVVNGDTDDEVVVGDSEDGPPLSDSSPMLMLLYGRTHHSVESFTIVEPSIHTSHVFISDAPVDPQIEKIKSVFTTQNVIVSMDSDLPLKLKPSASVSLCPPNRRHHQQQPAGDPENEEGYVVVKGENASAFRIYCPPNILTSPDEIKAVFLVPTDMENLTINGERDGNVEVDGSLLHGLKLATVASEFGDIRLRDVFAKDLRISTTKGGDVECQGTVHANVMIDVRSEGEVRVRNLDGPAVVARTDTGDITILGDCNSDMSHLATNTGNVVIQRLYGSTYILVHKSGFVTFSLIEGTATAIINRGGAYIGFDVITSDSSVQVGEGDIAVTIPSTHCFRIEITAMHTDIEPKLLNSGEFFLNESSHLEKFSCGSSDGVTDPSTPVLTLEAPKGKVVVVFSDKTSNQDYSGDYGSPT